MFSALQSLKSVSGSVLLKRGNFGHINVLRVVWGWELWVGTHIVINDPLPDEIW